MKLHPVVVRTSPKGGPFLGKCACCGKKGITSKMATSEECPKADHMTNEQAIVFAVEGGS